MPDGEGRRRRPLSDPQQQSVLEATRAPNDAGLSLAKEKDGDEIAEDGKRTIHLSKADDIDFMQPPAAQRHIERKGHDYRDVRTDGSARVHFGDIHNNHYHSSPGKDGVVDVLGALAFEGMGYRLAAVSPAYAQTCSWVFNQAEYSRWRDPTEREAHHGVLWIKGSAGTGKSTLMKHIYNHTVEHRNDEIIVAFFFNARSHDELPKSTQGMYRSLLHQLLHEFPALQTCLSSQQPFTENQDWPIDILENAFRVVINTLGRDTNVTCFIDALDECKEEAVRRAIGYFEDLSESVLSAECPFSICLSSRHYPHIEMRAHAEMRLDSLPGHMDDISQYVQSKLTLAEPFASELQRTVCDRCSGVFLWVVLVVKMIREANDSGKARSELRSILASLPDQLHDLFANILSVADSSLVYLLLWVLFPGRRRSWTVRELYFAVRTSVKDLATGFWNRSEIYEDQMERYLIQVSRGLLQFHWSTDAVGPTARGCHLLHESVREYLLDGGLASLDNTLRERTEAKSHARLAEVCQRSFDLIPSSGIPADESERRLRFAYPLYVYLCEAWLPHIELAFVGGMLDLTALSQFPLQKYIFLFNRRNSLQLKKDHSANLLYFLVMLDCYELTKALIMHTHRNVHASKRDRLLLPRPAKRIPGLERPDLETLCGGYSGSPLHLAAFYDEEELVEIMLDHGADINLSDSDYSSPLCMASQSFRGWKVVKLLLDRGAVINAQQHERSENASERTRTTKRGKRDVFRFLSGQDHTADPALDSHRDDNPLVFAAASAPLEIIQLFIRKGANVNAPGTSGPLHRAAERNLPCVDIVRVLLVNGADVNGRDEMSRTALHLVAEPAEGSNDSDTREIVKLLLDAGADLNAVDNRGRTPLLTASAGSKARLLKILLQHGANPSDQDQDSQSALYLAACSYILTSLSYSWDQPPTNDLATLRILLDAGANVDAVGGEYGTALIVLSAKGKYDGVRLLLDHRASLTHRNAEYGSASEAAQAEGHTEIVELLGLHEDIVCLREMRLRLASSPGVSND